MLIVATAAFQQQNCTGTYLIAYISPDGVKVGSSDINMFLYLLIYHAIRRRLREWLDPLLWH